MNPDRRLYMYDVCKAGTPKPNLDKMFLSIRVDARGRLGHGLGPGPTSPRANGSIQAKRKKPETPNPSSNP
jgi:hypothetical protein